MKIEVSLARKANRRNWAEYECAHAQFGPISFQRYIQQGHRAFAFRIMRLELVIMDLWIVRNR